MFEWFKQWDVRRREKAVQRHLGFLFERFGGGVRRIGRGNASEIWIEFGNVALHYWAHMSESGVVVGPVHDRTKRHELGGVLRFLAGDVEFPPQIRGLKILAAKLAPHAAELNLRLSPEEYPAFRVAMECYYPRSERRV